MSMRVLMWSGKQSQVDARGGAAGHPGERRCKVSTSPVAACETQRRLCPVGPRVCCDASVAWCLRVRVALKLAMVHELKLLLGVDCILILSGLTSNL